MIGDFKNRKNTSTFVQEVGLNFLHPPLCIEKIGVLTSWKIDFQQQQSRFLEWKFSRDEVSTSVKLSPNGTLTSSHQPRLRKGLFSVIGEEKWGKIGKNWKLNYKSSLFGHLY